MFTPKFITQLEPNECFVFGSNDAGRHGAGAAVWARRFGAVTGIGRGPAGQTYAIATKSRNLTRLSTDEIKRQVDEFLKFAKANPKTRFLVTEIGCGLAGYRPEQIAPMFFPNPPKNVLLPESFWRVGL